MLLAHPHKRRKSLLSQNSNYTIYNKYYGTVCKYLYLNSRLVANKISFLNP